MRFLGVRLASATELDRGDRRADNYSTRGAPGLVGRPLPPPGWRLAAAYGISPRGGWVVARRGLRYTSAACGVRWSAMRRFSAITP